MPGFLNKTASPGQVRELERLFQELWEANEEHAGEKTLEAQVYCRLTGLADGLEGRFRAWARDYFTRRADRRMVNPMVGNDPFLLFEKLLDEAGSIFGRLSRLKGTLSCTFLEATMKYTAWLLYDRLWKERVILEDGYFYVPNPPAVPDGGQRMLAYLSSYGWHEDRLGDFLARLRPCCDLGRLTRVAAQPEEATRAQLQAMADDVQLMRHFLAKGFKPRKATLAFGCLVMAWEWWVTWGIGWLIVGESETEVALACQTRVCQYPVLVGRDGLLVDAHLPWLQPGGPAAADRLGMSLLVLERFHELLFAMYDRIDFDRVGRPVRVAGDGGEATPDEQEIEAVAQSCRLLALSDPEAEVKARNPYASARRIPGLRAGRLLRLLSDRFGCEVRQGKGSEMIIHRPGAKIYTLRHHRREFEVHPNELLPLLKRLAISTQDFVKAVR